MLGEEGNGYIKEIKLRDRAGETPDDRFVYWDGSGELTIPAGEQWFLECEIYLSTAENEPYFQGIVFFLLQYEMAGQLYYEVFNTYELSSTGKGKYELSSIWLDGISMKEYYTEYYFKDGWEEWLNLFWSMLEHLA